MHEFDAAAYHESTVCLQQAIGLAQHTDPTRLMTYVNKTASSEMIDRIINLIKNLHVPVTKSAATELREQLSRGKQDLSYFHCGQLLVNLSETLRRELLANKLFSLDASKAKYYESTLVMFGDDFAQRFPSICDEIEQAGKAYACDLNTAAAFHVLRAMEAGIRAMCRCLGIKDPTRGSERNWSNISSSLKTEIDKRWPAATGRMSGDAQLFDQIYGGIVGMQNPYRNETMHLSAVYTAPQAIHIFELVKGLMERIASRMDERGDPKA